jgi:methyl coenzyme M reductase beta subunit
VGAAKFVLSGRDVKKGITETASNIASTIDKQIQASANPDRDRRVSEEKDF